MNKDELLQELSSRVSSGEISRTEVENKLNIANTGVVGVAVADVTHFSLNKMLYVLGASIVVVGIVIFASQIWGDIGSVGRILITLGLGFLFSMIGSFLLKQQPDDRLGSVFHLIGGLLIPGGAMVTLSELSTGVYSMWPIVFSFGTIFLFYVMLNFIHKNAILTFFAISNGTAFIYTLVEAIIGGSFYNNGEIFAYLTMVVGLSYMFLAYSFKDGWNKHLVGVLYFFGSFGFLGAAFSRVFGSDVWQVLYFFVVLAGVFFSVKLKSKVVLVASTLFLIAYISYITGKYFADSIGWPLALVLLGFIFIGLGYASININKKYITQ